MYKQKVTSDDGPLGAGYIIIGDFIACAGKLEKYHDLNGHILNINDFFIFLLLAVAQKEES